jgi:hypothetical protein
LFLAEAEGRSNKYKNSTHPHWIWPQQTSTQSNPSSRRWKPWGQKDPWSKTRTKRPGAENYNKMYKKLATKRKHLPNPQGKPNSEKNQKYQIRSMKHQRKPIRREGF